jgi:hypothetical protein
MSDGRELRCYDYVNHPYPQVRDAVMADPGGILQRATHAASTRAADVAANLKVSIGPFEVGADVKIEIDKVEDGTTALGQPMTMVSVRWQAVRGPGLFPAMTAELQLYALSPTETQLDLHGTYQPPLGFFGNALDALVGHRVAQASVLRFVQDVADYLRTTLTA